MPNWCANRMYFSAEPAQIAAIKRLASGAVTPFYRRATNEGIQLFVAGSTGLLQTTEDSRSCDDGADRWSGVVCRKIITPFLARGFFPGILRLSSGCAGRSGAVMGVVSLTVTG